MITALEVLRPRCGEAALTLLQRPGPLAAVVHELLEGLDSQAMAPCDDVLASLTLLLQHLPTWLHVVLLSRRDPALPVDRLQARGQHTLVF